jgi:hypothetical protein
MKTNPGRLTWVALLTCGLGGLGGLAATNQSAHAQFVRGGQSPYPGGGTYGGVSSSAYDTSGLQQFNTVNGIPLFMRQYVPIMATTSPYSDPTLRFPTLVGPGGYTTGGACTGFTCVPSSGFSSYPTAPAAYGPRNAFDRWTFDRERQAISSGPQKQMELQRQLTNPSPGDVTSGAALNAILDGLEPLVERIKGLPPTGIDDSLLKKMNFTHGAGSVGLLRDQGRIEWPALFLKLSPAEEVAKTRTKIEGQLQEAYRQVNEKGKADPDDLKNLLRSIEGLGDIASGQAQSMTFSQNVEVNRYLKSLEDSVAFLKQPDAGDWLPGKHKVKPESMQDLVRILIEKKIRFAPAIIGNDAAYGTMHRSLTAVYSQAIPAQGARP